MTEIEWLTSTETGDMLEMGTEYAGSVRVYDGILPVSTEKLRRFVVACRDLEHRLEPSRTRDDDTKLLHEPLLWNAVRAWTCKDVDNVVFPVSGKIRNGRIAHILRDVIGNPFRPTRIYTRWMTPDVRLLAQRARSERLDDSPDPFRLAVLADALEESGCTDSELLHHLRGQIRAGICDRCSGMGRKPTEMPSRFTECANCDGTGLTWIESRYPHVNECWAVSLLIDQPELANDK